MEFCITGEMEFLLLHNIKACLFYLLPGGKFFKKKFYIGNIGGDQIIVEVAGGKIGSWYGLNSGNNGNIVTLWSLVADKAGLSGVINKWLNKHITARYSYLDENNKVIAYAYLYRNNYRHVWYPKTSGKGLKPLYNIPGIIRSNELVIVKGEKRAEALIEHGIMATTVMLGIYGSISETDWSILIGKQVIILPDKDEKYAEKIAAELANLGILHSIPEGYEEGDVKQLFASNQKNIQAFPARQYLKDKSPLPKDIISPRILTPGGMLLLGGAPKVGKTDLLLSWLAYMSAGLPFLGMVPTKPLKIFYLQTDIEYHYIKERLQQLEFDEKSLELVSENLIITPKTKLLLDSEGVEKIGNIMAKTLNVKEVDIIAIDTLRSIFDFNKYKEENSNSSMFCFLKDRVEKLRAMTNPRCGIILTHNTKKVSKRSLSEEPFQSFSGASALRSLYTSGVMMMKDNEQHKLIFELRNGESIPAMQISKVNSQWRSTCATS
ncbi:AAA family ATPase [Wolbachia endosymbiont (group A) of Agelastica alni]